MRIRIGVSVASKIGFASHQNAVPLLHSLEVINETEEDFQDLTLTLTADLPFIRESRWTIPYLHSKTVYSVAFQPITLEAAFLHELRESITAHLNFTLVKGDVLITEHSLPIELLSYDQWGGYKTMSELLPAFVMPNDPAIDRILKTAADVLGKAGRDETIEGYKAQSRSRVWEITSAIWSALCGLHIAEAEISDNYTENGQKIRTPERIVSGQIANRLDCALLLAAVLEKAGLNPLVILLKETVLTGVWLQPIEFASLITDEAAALRRRIDLKDILLLDSGFILQRIPASLTIAEKSALRKIAPEFASDFEMAIDIHRARLQKIRPLSTVSELEDSASIVNWEAAEAFESAPALPAFDVENEEKGIIAKDRLTNWQRKLLELTPRNRLLNLPAKGKLVPLICSDPMQLEARLAEGKKLKITALPDLSVSGRDKNLYAAQNQGDLIAEIAAAALTRGEIMSSLSAKALEATLIDLYRKARSDVDEGGANTLFLAVGFLKWKRNPDEERHYLAPLILIPVTLERKSALSGVVMTRHEDEIRFNLTLLEMLRHDFNLTIPALNGVLPERDGQVDIEAIWTIIRHTIRDMKGFELIPESMLSTFSFVKYLMWKDLTDRSDQLKESPLVRYLLDRKPENLPKNKPFPVAENLDNAVKPGELFTPLPADSSQLAAIVASAKGCDFVLDGPPGTGKSQTIANIIAHNLALGRRVLFVAEKKAALDVVQRRLNAKGLGDFCLELHSSKATRAEVIKQLNRAWTASKDVTEEDWKIEAEKLRILRDNLNEVVQLLHQRQPNGLTLYQAIGLVVRDGGRAVPRLTFYHPLQHSEKDLAHFRDLARRLGLAWQEVGDLPQDFESVTVSEWSNGWQDAIVAAAKKLQRAVTEVEAAKEAIIDASGLSVVINTRDDLEQLSSFIHLLGQAYGHNCYLTFSPKKDKIIEAAHQAISLLKSYRKEAAGLSVRYDRDILKRLRSHPRSLWNEWEKAEQRFWFLAGFEKKKIIKRLAKAGRTKGKIDAAHDLPRLVMMARLYEKLYQLKKAVPEIKNFAGWKDIGSHLGMIEDECRFAEDLEAAIIAQAANPEHLITLRQSVKNLVIEANALLEPTSPLMIAARRLKKALQGVDRTKEHFVSLADSPLSDDPKSWLALAETVINQENRLQAWANWQRIRYEAVSAGLKPLVEAIESHAVTGENALSVFEAAYARWFASNLIDAEPRLRRFSSAMQMADIAAFRKLDDHLSELAIQYIRAQLSKRIAVDEKEGLPAGYATLKMQLQLKQHHMPIRQLITEMGKDFSRLTPCMLMSPLSVAQFLPPDHDLFDLVIFDEASQIAPWDAIGAMARGKQVIVAGDPRQMPPTSFFNRSVQNDDLETDTERDMESILDECLTAGIPMHSLSFHYRSRHESLIAFSNYSYYDGGLVTFPAPVRKESAVHWRRVEGVYSRGRNRVNAIEAQAMVDEAITRLTMPEFNQQGWSLGIITLNTDQQRLVEDLLDKARRDHPEIEHHFSDTLAEPVTVRNLETVQGIERDIIILGIGFGPTEPNAPTMLMSFGPLSAEGGWRRLNVALTRARQEMILFTSFGPEMIDLNRTTSRAVIDLKHFIEFADRGPQAFSTAVHGSLGGYDSPFEEAVAGELMQRGWQVASQIGVSRFRIDLGVVHPDRPGDYLAGVECDGATYHSAATARDRDKVRAAILSELGWKLLRVWSTDWWVDKQSAADHLHKGLMALLEEDRLKRTVPEALG
ncbi:MAG: DUF4011 domain-containing protein [Zymomonas mobilis subsp. pomaceae]|uniref:DUF4011 domain-containing protein n=1 Tax=Zymomonas mobilis TaxID=542 RepID=UPI0039E8E4C4